MPSKNTISVTRSNSRCWNWTIWSALERYGFIDEVLGPPVTGGIEEQPVTMGTRGIEDAVPLCQSNSGRA